VRGVLQLLERLVVADLVEQVFAREDARRSIHPPFLRDLPDAVPDLL